MAENTKIQWCDHTWSPWRGCTKVSEGCAHCYAETLSKRNPAVLGEWGPKGRRVINSDWGKPLAWDRRARESGTRPRVFPSLCDPFERGRPDLDVPRARFFGLVAATPRLDWLVLTKRADAAANYFARKSSMWAAAQCYVDLLYGPDSGHSTGDGLAAWPPRNVWMGVSVENQERADERVPLLKKIKAPVRWLSIEPLLGPIALRPEWLEWIDWVVVGGESGGQARPCDTRWILDLVRQCRAAGVAVFVKQLGAVAFDSEHRISIDGPGSHATEMDLVDPKGGDPEEWPLDLRVREMPNPGRALCP